MEKKIIIPQFVKCRSCRKEYSLNDLHIKVDGATNQKYLACTCGVITILDNKEK